MPDAWQQAVDYVNQQTTNLEALPAASRQPGNQQFDYFGGLLIEAYQGLANLSEANHYTSGVTVTGDPAPALLALDQAMQSFMTGNRIGAGQLALAKGGKVLFSHAYQLNGDYKRFVEPESLFRIASCSKMFTCAAIQTLYDSGQLRPTDAVFHLLGITAPLPTTQTVDPRVNTITVDNLVNHLGGWNDQAAFTVPNGTPGYADGSVIPVTNDAVFDCRNIALKLGWPEPLSKWNFARYIYGEPLQFVPGTPFGGKTDPKTGKPIDTYSNTGYALLGLVVEAVSGMPYEIFLQTKVLQPIGLSDVFVSRMANPMAIREVEYAGTTTGLSALQPNANVTVGGVNSGEGMITDISDSGGGLMSTAATMAQFINYFPAWGMGHTRGGGRSGSEAGVSSFAQSLDGLDWSYVVNTREFLFPSATDALYAMMVYLFATLKIM